MSPDLSDAGDGPQHFPYLTRPPRLLASTGSLYTSGVLQTHARERALPARHARNHCLPTCPPDPFESSFFRTVAFSADGSTLLTTSADHLVRTFILPPALLSSPAPLPLEPYATISPSGTSIYSLCPHPSHPIFVISARDTPIRMHSLHHPELLSAHPWINVENEKVMAAYSLLFTSDRTLLAGGSSRIGVFDISRSGEGASAELMTTPAKKALPGPDRMKGLISAMAVDEASRILAAGTFARTVGLYDQRGEGGCVGCWELDEVDEGGGITSVRWGEKYLYVAERRSEVVLVYDVRMTGKRLESLRGRRAETNQRVGVDLFGEWILGGGTDGEVGIWPTDGGEKVGWWKASEDVVGDVVMHPAGVVAVTCSGSRKHLDGGVESDDTSSSSSDSDSEEEENTEEEKLPEWDNAVKVWEVLQKGEEKASADNDARAEVEVELREERR